MNPAATHPPREEQPKRLHPVIRWSSMLNSLYYRETVWLLGDGRSGTTWLGEIMRSMRSMREMFEPIHSDFSPEIAPYGKFPYLPREMMAGPLAGELRRIFAGRSMQRRVQWRNHRPWYRDLLIKDIFGHLLVPWVDQALPHVKRVLIMRHPFAVACSKRRLAHWNWMTDSGEFLQRDELSEDFAGAWRERFLNARSFFEQQIVIWCFVHSVALTGPWGARTAVVFFEDLRDNGEATCRGLWADLGWRLPGSFDETHWNSRLERPSLTTVGDLAKAQPRSCRPSWPSDLKNEERKAGIEILDSCGWSGVYGDDPSPLVGARAAVRALGPTPGS